MPSCPPAPCPSGVCASCAFVPLRMVMVRAEHPSRLALDHCSGSGPVSGAVVRGAPRTRLCPGQQGRIRSSPEHGFAFSGSGYKIHLHGGIEEAPFSPQAPERAPGPMGAAPGLPDAGGRWVLGLLSGPRGSSVAPQLLPSKKNTLYLSSTYLPVVFQALPQNKQCQTMKHR